MNMQTKRPYRMQARAEAAQATAAAILDAAYEAFGSHRFDEVTLQEIAEAAGVTVQTVIRRFGSKEHLFDAVAEREAERVAARREVPPGADLRTAIETLVDHYEVDGPTVLHLLVEADRSPQAAAVAEQGRVTHRQWVERHLAPLLGEVKGADRRRLVDASVAATDLYTWKLLRQDLGRSREEVIEVMARMLDGLQRTTR